MSDETLTMHPDDNRFSFTTSATLLLTLMMLVLQSRAEDLVVDLVRGHQAPKPIASVRQLDVRAGDVLRLKSEFGDVYELSVASARRSALGNKIITGQNNTGARLTMVVTSDGVVQGSMRDAGQTFRITQNGDRFAWHAVDPYMAKPVDARAVKAPRRRTMMEMKQYDMNLMSTRSAPMSDVADETVKYPQYGIGLATIDVLFYHEEGMEDPSSVADFVIETANQAFLSSDIDITLNIVGLKPLPIDSETMQNDVLEAMSEAQTPFEDIENDRTFYAADIVVALRENIPEDDDSCGVAYIGVLDGSPWRNGYVTTVQWLPVDKAIDGLYCTDTSTAHEIGHILGSQHERRLFEEGDKGAYDFSFAHYREGFFKTIMSYGTEREINVFSSPKIDSCFGSACGVADGDPESADNARGFSQTRFMVSGYESETLAHELIEDFPIDETCELEDEGGEGFRKGHAISNASPHTIEIRGQSFLTDDGSVLTYDFDPGQFALQPNYFLQPSCRELEEDGDYGTTIKESWLTYLDPVSGKLFESLHLLWDEEYDGDYVRLNVTTPGEGAVEGQTTRLFKPDETVILTFVALPGYQLAEVDSTCGGSLTGNTFTLEKVSSDCLITPRFESSIASGDTLKVVLEEPGSGSIYSGVGNLRGWSVASVGIENVEIWIDGVYAFDAPYGGQRMDVGNANPDFPDSEKSGYALAWNYSNMSPGEHTMTARAYNTNGQYAERTSTFTVTRFNKPFIGANDAVSLDAAQCTVSDAQIWLQDASIAEMLYDIRLDWRTATQGFEIIEVD
ncbi:M12 family metallo-peptidase [Luminiphilus sp.]|nr:M12 family metallo-peptidase [Luminiphilus sp.]